MKMVKFQKGEDTYQYKNKYNGEWIFAKVRTGRIFKRKSLKMKQVYNCKFTISGRKNLDLQK